MLPSRIRAELQVNGGSRVKVLTCIENETPEHLVIKLAAYLAFWDQDLVLDPGPKHPALSGQEYRPDLLGVDVGGDLSVWVECGNTALNKLGKAARRWPRARIAVFKENEVKAAHLRAELEGVVPDPARVEVYCWPGRAFKEWAGLMAERVEVFGEAQATAFNLVVNERIYATDLLKL
ncbi:MAG: YaeQ family protein [Elusimicrobia bacterium]|nr:YaeQ family protein [Elusimicrobiota bacterium]